MFLNFDQGVRKICNNKNKYLPEIISYKWLDHFIDLVFKVLSKGAKKSVTITVSSCQNFSCSIF